MRNLLFGYDFSHILTGNPVSTSARPELLTSSVKSIQSAHQGETWSFKGRKCSSMIQWPLTLEEFGGTPSVIFSISIQLALPSLKLIKFPGQFSMYTGPSTLKIISTRAQNNSLFILLSKQLSKINALRKDSEKRGAV